MFFWWISQNENKFGQFSINLDDLSGILSGVPDSVGLASGES